MIGSRIGYPYRLGFLDTRYLVKAGVTGGQTAIGGTGVTDILKLQGTSGNGTLTSPAIQALVGNNGATTALTILNNGNVGIGTTGPATLLHLSANRPAFRINDTTAGTVGTAAFYIHFATASVDDVAVGVNRNPTTGVFVNSNRTASQLVMGSSVAPTSSYIKFYTSGTNGAVPTEQMRMAGGLSLGNSYVGTDPGAGSMIISGNVGIGTTGPLAKLHIDQSSTTGAKPVLTVDQADVSEEFIRFIGTSADTVLTQSIVEAADVSTATIAGYLKIFVQDDGNQLTDQAYYLAIYNLV